MRVAHSAGKVDSGKVAISFFPHFCRVTFLEVVYQSEISERRRRVKEKMPTVFENDILDLRLRQIDGTSQWEVFKGPGELSTVRVSESYTYRKKIWTEANLMNSAPRSLTSLWVLRYCNC
jgi:hypothetical protein